MLCLHNLHIPCHETFCSHANDVLSCCLLGILEVHPPSQISHPACSCVLCCTHCVQTADNGLGFRVYCNLLLPAGHQWGPPPDRGAQPRHLDAPGVYPWHGGQHWCQLCRHLQGQRPLPVSAFCLCHWLCLLLCLLPVPLFLPLPLALPLALPSACASDFAYCLCLSLLPVPFPTACAFPYCLCLSLLPVPFPTACAFPHHILY